MVITVIGPGDEFIVSSWEEGFIVKIRLHGITNEIKKVCRMIERNRCLTVVSISEVFPNKGTEKYFRHYMDIVFIKKTILKCITSDISSLLSILSFSRDLITLRRLRVIFA